jgi:hypothetical protein
VRQGSRGSQCNAGCAFEQVTVWATQAPFARDQWEATT